MQKKYKTLTRYYCNECHKYKMRFDNEDSAWLWICLYSKNYKYGGKDLRAYYCKECDKWHITHKKLIEIKN